MVCWWETTQIEYTKAAEARPSDIASVFRRILEQAKQEELARSPEHMTNALNAAKSKAKQDWNDIETAITHGRRVLLWGPPGTGKSFAAAQVAKNQSLFRLYLTMDTPAAEVRGHYLPNEKGGFIWHDGPGIAAWRQGGRLNIDEIDAASGDTLTLLMGLLDDPESARLTIPTRETVRPAEGFSCVATTNQQPTVMPEALLDRFDAVLHVKYPNPAVFAKQNWFKQSIMEAAERAVYLNESKQTGGSRPIALRAFRSIDRYHQKGLKIDDAARLVVGADAGRWLMTALKIAG